MSGRKTAVRVQRDLTPKQRTALRQSYLAAEAERPQIVVRAREYKRRSEASRAALRQTFQLLRSERKAQGITLQELERRTGIGRGALSRLENARDPNPTLQTVQRYAAALGKEVLVQLKDAAATC